MNREAAMALLDPCLVQDGPTIMDTRYNVPPELWYQELWISTIHWSNGWMFDIRGACCMDARYYPPSLMDGVAECVQNNSGPHDDSWWIGRWEEWK